MKQLRDRLALVTGAASGIGLAIAERLAAEGARLVLCDVHQERLAEARQRIGDACLMAEVVDVSSSAAVLALADKVHAELGAVDILVNNAGIAHVGGICQTTLEDWDRVLAATASALGTPVWLVAGVGRRLPSGYVDAMADRVRALTEDVDPWDLDVEVLPTSLVTDVIGPHGRVPMGPPAIVPECAMAHELLRHSPM